MQQALRQIKSIAPRLLRRERAASYLDISTGIFDKLVKDGVIPAPKTFHSFKAWDVRDLDQFVDCLPYAGDGRPDDTWA